MLFALTSMNSCAEEKTSYTQLFEKDKVIDVEININEDDLADIRAYPENEEYHAADITVDGITVKNAGIRTKGNMTLKSTANSDSERYSYRIKFNKFEKGNKLLGLDELCLNSGYSDPSYMREYLHYEILKKLGMNVPETAFCRVYINGEYAGFYLAVEGLDSTFLKDNFGDGYKNGNFYKMDEGSTLEYKDDENYTYADLKNGDDTEPTEFKAFVKKLNDIKTGEKGDIESFLNVDSVIKYIASNTVLSNYDSYSGNMHHNFYLYEDENGVFTVVPWDFNMSFGGFNGNNSQVGIDTPYISGSLETLPLINKVLSVPEYKEKYYECIKEIMQMLENFEDRVTELKSIISPYVKADTTAFYSYEEFDKATSAEETSAEETDGKKPFGGTGSIIKCVKDRLENLKMQFDGSAEKTTTSQSFGMEGNRPDRGGNRPESSGQNPPEIPGDGNMPAPTKEGNPPEMPNGSNPPEMPDGENRMGDDFPFGPNEGVKNRQNDNSAGERDSISGKDRRQNKDNPIRVHVNGHIISFDNAPYIKNDTTLVGFRAILEALGAEVKWDEASGTVTAEKDGTQIKLVIGESTAYVDGKEYELTIPAEISNDSTMIPIRFISENLGMKVSWDGDTKLIEVNSK